MTRVRKGKLIMLYNYFSPFSFFFVFLSLSLERVCDVFDLCKKKKKKKFEER